MEIGRVKENLQGFFTDGLVTIVGSGLSFAEGIPGMKELGDHLLEVIPDRLRPRSSATWGKISESLSSGMGLESVLLKHQPDGHLESLIATETSCLILEAEQRIIAEVIQGTRRLRFAKLLQHMLKPPSGIPVITTNYDRLIEIAAETHGLGVNGLFVGQNWGKLDPSGSQHSLCRGLRSRGKQVQRMYCEHVTLLKPHGSLDWFLHGDEPIRCAFGINNARLIITPGVNKFRGGYERPFDAHRERANKEIDQASRFLLLGYGFNDDHLQTHLEPKLRQGTPGLILAHGLTPNARKLVSSCSSLTAVIARQDADGAEIISNGSSEILSNKNIWDLNHFIDEILEP